MKSVVLSIDAELGWGFVDNPEPPSDRVKGARIATHQLIDLFEYWNIPATWAMVGHLFLDACDGQHENHPGDSDWFRNDPGGDEKSAPTWFGRSLVSAIQESHVDHEIGSHSFSHMEFGAPYMTKAAAEAEVSKSIKLANRMGIEIDSFVFPRNNIGYRDILTKHGISCYRGVSPSRWYDESSIGKVGKGYSFVLGKSGPPIINPYIDNYGLVNIPSSMAVFSFEGAVRSLVKPVVGDPVVRQARRGLEQLSSEAGGVLHLWLHPNNITGQRDLNRVDSILREIHRYREELNLDVSTMGDVATKVTNEQQARVP